MSLNSTRCYRKQGNLNIVFNNADLLEFRQGMRAANAYNCSTEK